MDKRSLVEVDQRTRYLSHQLGYQSDGFPQQNWVVSQLARIEGAITGYLRPESGVAQLHHHDQL